jgi:hypothetical protein
LSRDQVESKKSNEEQTYGIMKDSVFLLDFWRWEIIFRTRDFLQLYNPFQEKGYTISLARRVIS